MAARRVDTRPADLGESLGRWQKAVEWLREMQEALHRGSNTTACVLAIKAAIAACDTFTIHHLKLVCISQRHEDAVEVFERVQGVDGAQTASQHLNRLLHAKGWIDYSDRLPRQEEAQALCTHAERFVAFVRR